MGGWGPAWSGFRRVSGSGGVEGPRTAKNGQNERVLGKWAFFMGFADLQTAFPRRETASPSAETTFPSRQTEFPSLPTASARLPAAYACLPTGFTSRKMALAGLPMAFVDARAGGASGRARRTVKRGRITFCVPNPGRRSLPCVRQAPAWHVACPVPPGDQFALGRLGFGSRFWTTAGKASRLGRPAHEGLAARLLSQPV